MLGKSISHYKINKKISKGGMSFLIQNYDKLTPQSRPSLFMKTIWTGFSILFLLLSITALRWQAPPLSAQTFSGQRFKFEHITVAQGLSQSSVQCMMQDRPGL